MALGDSTGHSEQGVSGGSMVQTLGIYVAFGGNMAIDINTDSNCGKATDSVMILSSSLARISPWPQVAVQVIWINMAPAAAWPVDTNMAPDGSLDSQHWHSL